MPTPLGYSKVLLGTETASTGPIYRSIAPPRDAALQNPANPDDPFVGLTRPEAPSLYHSFIRTVQTNGSLPCLGIQPIIDGVAQPYTWITYEQVGARVSNVSAGMVHLDLIPRIGGGNGDRMIAIYMKNSIDWVVVEHAAYSFSAVVIAVYDTLGPDSTQFILNQTEITTIVCTAAELPKLTQICSKCPNLKNVVISGGCNGDVQFEAECDARAAGLNVLHLELVETEGRKHPNAPEPPTGEDVATIMYTSGTTGDPKGAMLTHAGILCGCSAVKDFCSAGGHGFTSQSVYLSYLPLAHILERTALVHSFSVGSRVGFSQNNPLKLIDDMKALRPTVFITVPRLLNRIYDLITAKMLNGKKSAAYLFTMGVRTKLRRLRRYGITHHAFWDRLIFRKIRAGLGLDRCEFIISGSAPLSSEVLDFCRIALLSTIVEGYGQTETCGGVTATPFEDLSAGFVGTPNTGIEIRLETVPDMGYFVTDRTHGEGSAAVPCLGRGEICVRGPLVFKGYYKQPDKTAEAMDANGWLHTGDIGLWSPLGQLRIIDRKKNIFKLSQGEYVAPEKIENVLITCPSIAQVFVAGDSLHSHVVGIIVPDEPAIRLVAKINGLLNATFRELCDHDVIRTSIKKEIEETSKRAKLAGFERVREIYLHHDLFTVDNELLTPTFKLRRADAQKRFKSEIDHMYELTGDSVVKTAIPS
ncbi:Long-chain-fatty-acid-CoA ligase [Phytophthora megakarya]|uniref:Long-chain-fatty-acid-CoA ligase n=1 Tax=Phytophthora megakarya TaxID=4795 RepID=A0A225X251_9STRA|nr:Long-chain-fatty-acid-CoA ligase [Phytophthora megakarya]